MRMGMDMDMGIIIWVWGLHTMNIKSLVETLYWDATTKVYFRTCDAKHFFRRIQSTKMQSRTFIEKPM